MVFSRVNKTRVAAKAAEASLAKNLPEENGPMQKKGDTKLLLDIEGNEPAWANALHRIINVVEGKEKPQILGIDNKFKIVECHVKDDELYPDAHDVEIFSRWKKFNNFVAKKREFIVEDKNRDPKFKINLTHELITVKLIKDALLDREEYFYLLHLIHDVMKRLSGNLLGARKIISKDEEAIVTILQLGANDLVDYKLTEDEYNILQKSFNLLEKDYKEQDLMTYEREYGEHTINIYCKDSSDDSTTIEESQDEEQQISETEKVARQQSVFDIQNAYFKHKVQSVLNKSLIPQLVNESVKDKRFANQGSFYGDIEISAKNPMLAIKQFELLTASGFKPTFAKKTWEAIQNTVYLKFRQDYKKMKKDEALYLDKQLTILAPLKEDGQIDSKLLKDRIIFAMEKGFLVNLEADAKTALQDYMYTQEQPVRIKINVKDNVHIAFLMFEMLPLGFIPDINTSSNKLHEISLHLQEIARINNKPLTINSGNLQHDLLILKFCWQQLKLEAMPAKSWHEIRNLASKMKDTYDRTIDLTKLSAKEQAKLVEMLATMGLMCKVNKVPKNTEIIIGSLNPSHALEAFDIFLNQGLAPRLSDREPATLDLVREMLQYGQREVALDSRSPLQLISHIKQCVANGLVPILNPKQKRTVQRFMSQNKVDKPFILTGFHGQAVRNNIKLLVELNLDFVVTQTARKAYYVEQSFRKKAYQPVLAIDLAPAMKKLTRFFGAPLMIPDYKKTIEKALQLSKDGFYIHLPEQVQEVINNAKDISGKRGIKGWFAPKRLCNYLLKQVSEFRECNSSLLNTIEKTSEDDLILMAALQRGDTNLKFKAAPKGKSDIKTSWQSKQ